MKLDWLLNNITTFSGITDDSRDVEENYIFIAGGGRKESDKYLKEAIIKGASLIVTEQYIEDFDSEKQIIVEDRREAAAILANVFYNYPSRELVVIGVTGTCGKTTTTYILESIFEAAGYVPGVIGTENIRYSGLEYPSPNTTPSSIILQKTMRKMIEHGCNVLIMEVSSHAIAQKRTYGVLFNGAIFTNLSLEHLDFHASMEEYFNEKVKLFTEYAEKSIASGKNFVAAVNVKDIWGERLYLNLRDNKVINKVKKINIDEVKIISNEKINSLGICAEFEGILINSKLIGNFNLENLIGSILLCKLLGLTKKSIESGILKMKPVPGRMELVANTNNIIVDFAHKPGALQVVLNVLNVMKKNNLICVFGCGGERDHEKRPLMGKISSEIADLTILTSDNTRGENPNKIIEDIIEGVDSKEKIMVIVDREEAIRKAINILNKDDILLIAGRGAEAELIVNDVDGVTTKKIKFDDRKKVEEIISEVR